MTLTTASYDGTTVAEVINSLQADKSVMDFMVGQNLPTGDVLEAIATAMVMSDPQTVTVDEEGKVTTSDEVANV